MPTNSYTRQSSFSNGDVIDAGLLNAEFDQLELAFDSASGHDHSGDAGKGSTIPLIAKGTSSVKINDNDPLNTIIEFYIKNTLVGVFDEANGFSADTFNIKIEDLVNVGAPLASGFFRWSADGTTVTFSTLISTNDISGLSTVATSGSLIDLGNVSFSGNGYSFWNGTSLVNISNIPASDISGLDAVNFTYRAQNMDTFLADLDSRSIDSATVLAAAAAADQSAQDAAASAASIYRTRILALAAI